MKYVRFLFLGGVVFSALFIGEVVDHFFDWLFPENGIFILLAFLLMTLLSFVPMLTVWLGIFLAIHTVLRLVPRVSRMDRGGLFVLSAALTVGGLELVPVLNNRSVDQALALAVAEDVPLSTAMAPGSVVGFHADPGVCGQTCAELVMAAPGLRLVLGRFDEAADGKSAVVPPDAETWALAPSEIGLCPWDPTEGSVALRIALAEAELEGYCVTHVPGVERLDILIRQDSPPTDASGQTPADDRLEMFLRDGDVLRVAYRRTTGVREKLARPLMFYMPETVVYIGNELALGPARFRVPLESPVSDLTPAELIDAALPIDFTILDRASFRALSEADQDVALQRLRELMVVLDLARREAALAALQSNDADRIADGITIAEKYLRRAVSRAIDTSDLPLLLAVVSAPGELARWTHAALRNAPPEVLLPVADAARDRLNAIGDARLEGYRSRQSYERIVDLAEERFPGE
jgi:hypothetical protein